MNLEPTDVELIDRARRDDHDAFAELYNRYRLPLYSYLGKMLPGAAHVTDDIFQQTWIKVSDSLEKYEHRQKFVSWLFRIAHNLVIDHFRRCSRHNEVEMNERIPADNDPVWADMDREVISQALEKAIAQLSVEQREVVALRQKNVSFKEIAEIQGTGINTSLGRMHHAVKRLRNLMAEYVNSPGER